MPVGILADLVDAHVWQSPAWITGLTLGAILGIGNMRAWRRGFEPTEMA